MMRHPLFAPEVQDDLGRYMDRAPGQPPITFWWLKPPAPHVLVGVIRPAVRDGVDIKIHG